MVSTMRPFLLRLRSWWLRLKLDLLEWQIRGVDPGDPGRGSLVADSIRVRRELARLGREGRRRGGA